MIAAPENVKRNGERAGMIKKIDKDDHAGEISAHFVEDFEQP
jgi:hypothetical protein